MNQLEAINYVFTSLMKKFAKLFEFCHLISQDAADWVDEETNKEIDKRLAELYSVCRIIESHLTQPDPTTLTDFVKVCDELQKILPKPVDDSSEDDIVKQENS